MPDTGAESSRSVARVVWGVLLVWMGAAWLLHWSWGVGLIGAGAILLAAQAYRSFAGLRVDGFGLVAGLMLVACGVWNLFDVAFELMPILCIGAGIALLVSTWRARRAHRAVGAGTDLHAPSHPRV